MHHRRTKRRTEENEPSTSSAIAHNDVPTPPSATSSLQQQLHTRASAHGRCSQPFVSLGIQKPRLFLVGVIAVILVIHFLLLRPILTFLFGARGSPLGGVMGIFIDSQLRHYLFRQEVTRWNTLLLKEGIVLPDAGTQSSSNAKLKTLPNYAIGLSLLREARRRFDGGSDIQLTAEVNSSAIASWVETSQQTRVTVTESHDAQPLRFVPKVSLQQQMRESGCEPSWLCFRCLKAPNYGSYESCSSVCKSCSHDIICSSRHEALSRRTVEMKVRVGREARDGWLIPRIIHQTWFEELNPDKYPQLVRLQNSWKNSGWDYRFYTDSDIEAYIEKNFPTRFLRAYQALTPGAYKADFFRYLVLMRDGGIYADVDVMLDATLNSFVTPTMGFFVPLDAVGQQVDENFCLWNGLIGSAPGHPFVIRAVERMMNLVLNRADLYDMEGEICRNEHHGGEIWKTRIEPNLLLSGPCALGVAVNEALGKDPVSKFRVGLESATTVSSQNIPGDSLILVLDKNDLGALRMSDVDRNVIFATTDMQGLSKDPIKTSFSNRLGSVAKNNRVPGERPPHYSLAGKGDWLWGTRYVYSDDLTANEVVMFKVEQY